jgi:NAD(P)-dependent dehydrogenase (short-subunit alcohol dehydrogenase family)
MSKKVLITGANGGFGFLTVKELIARGHQVVGTMRAPEGRSAEQADALKALGAHIIAMDVTSTESVNAGVAKANDLLGGLDIIINNAGVGVSGMTEHFTPEDLQKLFDVNVFGVQRVNRAALPILRSQGDGLLIHVSSLLGRITLPFYGPYNASKWALEALAENYRIELSGFGIESCVVEPGGYPTTFMVNLMQPSDNSRAESYGEFMNAPAAMGESFQQALANNTEQRPEKVALAIADLIDKAKGERPFRTVVDSMGMGEPVKQANELQGQITHGIFSAFGIEGMLSVKN